MLDLSFLTEEEYGKLLKVLQRDAELKKKDSDRIRRLQGSLKDEKKKKFVTGEWFHEAKAQRFREDLEGSDLLRASIRKKNSNSDGTDNELIPQNAESGQAVLPTDVAVLSSSFSEEGRLCEPGSAEGRLLKSKPRVKLSTRPSSLEKKSSVEDVSPADSGVVVSPFVATRENSEVGFELSPGGSTKLPDEFFYSVGDYVPKVVEDIPDGVKELGGFQPALQREVNPPSRIPVNRKSSKPLFSPNFTNGDGAKKSGLGLEKTHVVKSFKFPPVGEENSPPLKLDANRIIISSVNTKDDEIGVDHAHFKNLKNFWEKGGEPLLANDAVEKANPIEVNGRPSRLNRSVLSQSNQGQTSDDKLSSNMHTKIRTVYNRSMTLSSSEDEPVYTSPPRKGSGSCIPRSSYGRRKGSMGSRSHLSEGNGKQSSAEEERKVQRSTKRSKIPVCVPSVKIDTPIKGQTGIIYEPEIPADEFVMIEESKRKVDSLAGRVQILIESVPSEEMDPGVDVVGRRPDLDHLEMKEILPEAEFGSFMEDLPENEVEDENQDSQEVEYYVPSEGKVPPAPVFKKIRRTNGCNLAKSMVNLYTTTETYTKPQVLSHQYLEPERAKELSRSSPFLLSETESDTASEISFQFNRHKKTSSLGSHSSDMASISSVSGSVLSVYSGDFGSVDAQGLVQFALDYDEKNQEFQIFVSQCKDLAIVEEKKGRTDPYVKTYLLPDKARMGKRKTSVKKRTTSPIYNEVLRYKIQKMVLLIQKLNLSVWHNDPLGRNSFLGEMEIDLASWDWRNNKLNWYMLKPRSLSAINGVDHRGVMNLSIKYVPPGSLGRKNPPSGEVHIWVKDTKDLPQLRPSGVDSFVKCYVLPDTSKKSYQKTRIVKRDSNPVFNHTIVYDGFHTEDLKDACVELTVWDHEKLTNHFLGGIRLGLGTGFSYGIAVDWMDSTQEEVAFWQEMMSTPNEWIEGSLLLRSLVGRSNLK
ncbi:synaptotagmin-like protein 2 isoform X2 [Thamnophis elegans]|uniref:synaptotagmin-like protein 2 isoform X2 n=1 Tax=Thamnophis elegans TaxID=35005 RepID=UPI00137829A0|nr:synaptotagmin-like protein 2 isoform X2 [Thamnophis elegans]